VEKNQFRRSIENQPSPIFPDSINTKKDWANLLTTCGLTTNQSGQEGVVSSDTAPAAFVDHGERLFGPPAPVRGQEREISRDPSSHSWGRGSREGDGGLVPFLEKCQ